MKLYLYYPCKPMFSMADFLVTRAIIHSKCNNL